MKKLFTILLLLVPASVFADTETDFIIFQKESYNTYFGKTVPEQGWNDAKLITLKVPAGSTVYITNYISNWYGDVPNLGDSDYLAGYDMSAGKYGYVYAERLSDTEVVPVGPIHYGDGSTKMVEYHNLTGPEKRETTGYLLDYFKDEAEIFFVMTPNGYDVKLNSYDPVHDPYNVPSVESELKSRHVNPLDQATNARVEFGVGPINLATGTAHEFVTGYVADPPSGTPLPGVLISGLIFAGVASAAHKLRAKRA